MDTSTLPRHAYHHLIYTLRRTLPPAPPDPDAAIARDYAAIAQVASLCPANAAEAAIAAQAVAANAQAMETMGLANNPATDPKRVLQCVAQVASMMRQAQGALRVLHAMQAERRKREADNAAADSSAWIEYGAAQWMAEALPIRPAPAPTSSGDDPMDQSTRGHETESSDSRKPPPDAEITKSSQNTGHILTSRIHETESAERSDAPRDAGVTSPSPAMRHILTPQTHETKSVIPRHHPSDQNRQGERQEGRQREHQGHATGPDPLPLHPSRRPIPAT